MGLMDKLKFWKSDEPQLGHSFDGLDPNFGKQSDNLGLPSQDPGLDTPGGEPQLDAGIPETQMQSSPDLADKPLSGLGSHTVEEKRDFEHVVVKEESIEKNLELISSKIDMLKAMIESINHRLSAIEKFTETKPKKRRPDW